MEMTLLEKFADPNLINTLGSSEKMLATLYTTLLGMGITFTALLVIWATTAIMSKIIIGFENNVKSKADIIKNVPNVENKINKTEEVLEEDAEDEELIAVIAAAVAASLNTSIHNIVVRNIVRVTDNTPAWGKTGIIEQMNSRF